MVKNTDRDIRFVLYTVGFGLLLLAFLQAFGPYLGKPDPQHAQILEVMHHVKDIGPADVPALIERPDGKPVLMVIYASWCPYCQQLMPNLFQLVQGHRLDNVALVLISVDDRPDFLAMYIVHHGYENLYTPYRTTYSLKEVLAKAGSHFKDHIPYIGFFDKHGKCVADFGGIVDKDVLLETAKKL